MPKSVNSSIRTLLIDDESLARQELALMLKKYPQIDVVGEAENADKAIKMINELEPDLIFLDIGMPVKSGFDMLEELVSTPFVVFVTAYDEYALKAFEADALDYVVKPINPVRLEKAIAKIMKSIEIVKPKTIPINDSMRNVFIKDGNHSYFIKLTDIHYIKSVGNYCEIYFGNNKAFLHKSLNLMEERIPSNMFFRANRQEIFNLEYVEDVDVLIKNVIQITLKTGKMVELSTRQSIKFREIMSI